MCVLENFIKISLKKEKKEDKLRYIYSFILINRVEFIISVKNKIID